MTKYAIIFQLHSTGCVLIEFRVPNHINKMGSNAKKKEWTNTDPNKGVLWSMYVVWEGDG